MIEIHHLLLQRIYQQAKKSYPYECCGILIGRNQERKRVEDILETENQEVQRGRDRYVIDGRDFFRVDKTTARKGLEIIGFYHSHPDFACIPSSTDQELAWQGYSYLIVSLGEGKKPEFKSWVLEETGKGLVEEEIYETGRNEG